MLSVYVNVDGVNHKMDTIVDAVDELEPALKKFGAYLKHRAQEKYKAQNFVPLAPATIAKREQKGLRQIESKFGSELRSSLTSAKAKESTKERRAATLLEFQREYRNGRSSVDWKARGYDLEASKTKLSLKQMVGLHGRVNKAVQKAVNSPVLGKLGSSLRVTIEDGTVTLASRTKGNWSAVHNEGDGHNPKRETIKLEAKDLDVFVEILRDHFLMRLED